MEILLLIIAFIVGACLGSFLCCQARRLRLKDKTKTTKLPARSVCLNCKTKLRWYDNIPIVSWLMLKGKCRKCGKKIGLAELFSELGTGFAFLLLCLGAYLDGLTLDNFLAQPPLYYITIAIFFVLLLTLIFLAIYDGLYGELPTSCLTISIICAIIIISLKLWDSFSSFGFSWNLLINPLLAVLVLGGLYLALYLISKGKWVGDGDWLLATSLGLALGSPWLALITLFIANLSACLFALPKFKTHPTIHFGPFLVLAFVITLSFSTFFNSLML